MQLRIQWTKPISLMKASDQNLIYVVEPNDVPDDAGVYVFGRRRRNGGFEALYVGRANSIRRRVWRHRKNLPLMKHLVNAKQGQRVVRAGVFVPRQSQSISNCLPIIENALIKHFLLEGHDLVNKQGTRLRRHEISSEGRHPNLFIPRLMFVDR